MEYHPNPSVAGHDFLNIEDLLDGDVCKLIGDICKKRGLGEDPYRDRQLKENYARKYERLRFRPLFVQIYVQAWIENGQSDNDYRNYRELLDAVIKKEVEHFSSIFDGDINSVSSLIHLLVRASVSPLVADVLPDGYKDFWSSIQKYIQNHSLPGFGRKQKTQSMIKETTQSLNLEESIIDPLYPDLIKEALFLSYVDDYDSFGQELWENEPGIFSVFLYRCLIDFPDNDELVDYVCRQSNDKSNIYAMRSRQALMHRDVIAPGDDPEKLNEIADREYTYWLSVDGSGKIYQELRIDGLTSVLHTFLGWSRKEAFQIMDDIISSPGDGKLETKKIDAILETAQYFTKWSSFEASENTIGKLKNYAGLSHESELEIRSLHIINQAGLVGLKLYHGQHDKEWEKVQNLIDKLRDTCDMGSEQDAEVYTRTILEVTKLAQIRFAGGPGCDIFYLLQDYAEEWAKHGKVAFNDQIHYNYLYAKYIHVDNVAVSSILAFGNSLYAVRLIDDYIKEVTGNSMIRDFSGLLIGAYALKVGYDDNVTDHEANNYLGKAEELLDVYPDSALLAAKYIELMDDCYEYQFKRRIPQNRVAQAFSIVLRFPEEYEVLDNFYKLLKNSEEKHNWVNYVKIKSVVNGLIRNRLDEYLVKPEDEKQETVVRSYKKIGRNEPCPCGSGKKFKKCCLGKGIYD